MRTRSSQLFRFAFQHAYKPPAPGQRMGCCVEPPRAPVHDMTHVLRMSCENADCEQMRKGWVIALDPGNYQHATARRELEARGQWRYVELQAGEAVDWIANHGAAQGVTDDEGKLAALVAGLPPHFTVLLFPPGQPCLRGHVDRDVVFTHHGVLGGMRIHERPLDWNEHFNEETYRLDQMVQRG